MDIEKARYNMIEQQIRPWNVLDERVLETLATVRREDFVPAAYRGMAFADVEIPLLVGDRKSGEFMFSPKVEARILQAVAPRRHEAVMEIGTGSGFGTALLAHHARQVTSVEIHPELATQARANLERADVRNARVVDGDGSKLEDDGERFDVIVLSGSVSEIPSTLLERLQPEGRLAAIVGDAPTMTLRMVTRQGPREWVTETLFETVAPRLRGFAEAERFRF